MTGPIKGFDTGGLRQTPLPAFAAFDTGGLRQTPPTRSDKNTAPQFLQVNYGAGCSAVWEFYLICLQFVRAESLNRFVRT